ncbi:hypothetical protein BDY17DRAFT_299328 [Neohortaea acidophila]|uniref:Secreted protein n=1 Tax=Neohortaea acidophila TaxID=245834 RepID=A0A6A6PP75_9PEZI|nr:uncharacterized protein BDY17DRAFT_299328 [Neohortaea acidophila]KAF2481606.1 hypothetical protein BDY17DRAFT_299328 [Neohortaea acidophila]
MILRWPSLVLGLLDVMPTILALFLVDPPPAIRPSDSARRPRRRERRRINSSRNTAGSYLFHRSPLLREFSICELYPSYPLSPP